MEALWAQVRGAGSRGAEGGTRVRGAHVHIRTLQTVTAEAEHKGDRAQTHGGENSGFGGTRGGAWCRVSGCEGSTQIASSLLTCSNEILNR